MSPTNRAKADLRLLVRLAAVLVFEAGAVVALHWAGRYRFLRVPFDDLDRWLSDAPPEDVLAAAIRLVGLVIAWWVLASTVLYAINVLWHQPSALRSVSWMMLPGARRVLDGILALSITGSSLTVTVPSPATSLVVATQPEQPRPATRAAPPDAIASKLAIYPQSTALPAPPPNAPTHQVAGGESLLDIAAERLGDPARWVDIWRANAGRLRAAGLAPNDRPQIGWTLVLPGPQPTPGPLASGAVLPAEAVIVEPGDNLWDLAETWLTDHLQRSPADDEVAPYWREAVDTNIDHLASGDPNLIYPGERITLPALPGDPVIPPAPNGNEPPPPPAPANNASTSTTTTPVPTDTPAATPAIPSPTSPTTSTPSKGPAASPAQPDTTDGDPDTSLTRPGVIALAGVTTALASLTLRALARRRRARHRTARPGTETPPRPAADVTTEQVLAGASTGALDRAWQAAQHLRVTMVDADLPTVTGIVVTPHGDVTLHLQDPAPPAAPFTASPDGADAWLLDAGQDDTADTAREAAPLLETVVAVGRTDDGSWVFVDLESLGAITIDGDPTRAAHLARSITAELALQPANHYVDITVAGGLEPPAGTEHQGVMVVDHLDETLVRQLHTVTDETTTYLATEGAPTTAAGRAQGLARDALVVTVVVANLGTDPVLLGRLADAAVPGGRGLAVVALDPLDEPATHLVVDPDGTLHLPHLGLTATAAGLDADDLHQLDNLLEREPANVAPTQPRAANHTPATPPPPMPTWDYLVRIFAAHRVETPDGNALSFRYGDPGVPNKNASRGAELLTYLSLRPDRAATIDEIRDHLWWGGEISARTAETLVSGTRRRLGGTRHISHIEGAPGHKRYTLQPAVVTDLDLLEHDLAHAQAIADEHPDQAAELLRHRLVTIATPAFDENSAGAGLAEWAGANRIVDRVQQPVIDAAALAADLYTSQGPPGRPNARFVIDQALKACPHNEALTRTAMQLDALSGHREAAHSRYIALARNLARDELEPEPETTAVHREITNPGQSGG